MQVNILFFSFISFVFQYPFTSAFPLFQFSDETLAIVAGFLLIRKPNLSSHVFIGILCALTFAIYVTVMSAISEAYRGFFLTLLDIFLFLKVFMVYFYVVELEDNVKNRLRTKIVKFFQLFFIIGVVAAFVNLITPIFHVFEYRFGVPSFQFFTANPGELGNIAIIGVSFILISNISNMQKLIYIFFCIIILLLTTRYKSFVIVVALLLLTLTFGIKYYNYEITQIKRKIKSKKRTFILFSPFVLLPGLTQFQYYFIASDTPRLILLLSSWDLFISNFPFGAGAGTFASGVAKMFYSPIYSQLGFEGFYGLNSLDGRFLNDSFWPIVLGQYGFVGLLIVLWLFYCVLKPSFKAISPQSSTVFANYLMIGAFILSTLGSAIVLSSLGMMYVIFFGLVAKRKNGIS